MTERYETDRLIPSLTEVRKKEREEREKTFSLQCKTLLIKCVKFYNENYPKSNVGLTWSKTKANIEFNENIDLNDILERFSEKQLNEVKDMFIYCHDERLIVSIPDHEKMKKINAIINSLIPGGNYIDRLKQLEKENEKTSLEISEIDRKIKEEKDKFNKRLEKKIKEPIIEQFICEICGQKCANKGGLTLHKRTHEENNEKQE